MPEGLPGWYPDPAGVPRRYRYWDGSQWSAITTDDPREPLLAEVGQPEMPGDAIPEGRDTRAPARRRLTVIIAVIAVIVIGVVSLAVYLGNLRPVADRAGPTPTKTL